MDLRHNQRRGRPIMPGTSTPSPSPVPKAVIAPENAGRPGSINRPGRWVLSFVESKAPELEPLTGWTASSDPLSQIRIPFPDVQSAIAFAQRKGWDYDVAEPRGSRPAIWFDPVYAREILYEQAA